MMDIFEKKGIHPMLISEMVAPYDDPESIFELKLDGIRCVAYIDNNFVDLRNKRDFKLLPRYPELKNINLNCNCKCILDGELIVTGSDGKPDFYKVQSRSTMTNVAKIQIESERFPASFVAYDIIYKDNKLVNEFPLMQRKEMLSKIVTETPRISVSRYIDTNGIALYEFAKQQELEGIVGKKKSSLYWFGKKTKEWNKVKWLLDDDYIAIGFIPKANNMTSLILAKYNKDDNLEILEHVTLGVSVSKLRANNMEYGECPLKVIPPGNEKTIWIKPMVCTVSYMPAKKNSLREARLKAIRTDKLPTECRL